VQFTPKPLPLDALLMEVIEEQQLNLDPQTINLSLHIDEPTETLSTEPFMLAGDWDQLARLFTNLISNALRYASPDTSPAAKTVISVQLRQLVKDRHPYLQVKVQDNGPGIPPSALAHLFDRFYRVDPARSAQYREGTGLGLAIAQVIVQNHQGQISVESSQAQGTTFMVTLPGDVISGS
ncbi:MAG: sensor histidine kinase, partial [Microcystaceae cyanobacterium]